MNNNKDVLKTDNEYKRSQLKMIMEEASKIEAKKAKTLKNVLSKNTGKSATYGVYRSSIVFEKQGMLKVL